MERLCSVRSWPNGTRCRDSMKVLWCHFHLVWLVFEGSIPTGGLLGSHPHLVRFLPIISTGGGLPGSCPLSEERMGGRERVRRRKERKGKEERRGGGEVGRGGWLLMVKVDDVHVQICMIGR